MQFVENEDMTTKIQASIEITPKQAIESAELPGLFPKGVRVYLADIGVESQVLVKAARRVSELGYTPVPHFAARRLTTRAALEDRIKAMVEHAGVGDVLVVGGGPDKPLGEFSCSMQVLETGLFDKYGIKEIALAGHPEGSPDFSDVVALDVLKLKADFGERSDAHLRIVTQFGFDADKFIAWAEGLRDCGVNLPVHLGVAGPAKITTLIKYAAMCGVGNSLGILKKRAGSFATLMTGFSPESVVGPIERHASLQQASAISQIHVFPFGGIGPAAEWLKERGSWGAQEAIRTVANA